LERLREIDPRSESWEAELSAITSGVVDLLLASQVDALADATDPLRDALANAFDDAPHAREIRGWLLGLLSLTRWALQRLPSTDELEFVRGGLSGSFLQTLEGTVPRSSTELGNRLGTSAPQISRLGRELRARGLVVQRRLGRHAMWELTPRGRQLLRESSQRLTTALDPRLVRPARPTTASSNGTSGARESHRAPSRSSRSTGREHSGNGNDKGGRDVHHVLPNSDGGWRVAKTPKADAIEVTGTQREAVAKAREIIQHKGGGSVNVHARNGKTIKQINIAPH
jgi:DNA-binding transcriptional ArsR family regulator